jgi:hypothetical protein
MMRGAVAVAVWRVVGWRVVGGGVWRVVGWEPEALVEAGESVAQRDRWATGWGLRNAMLPPG